MDTYIIQPLEQRVIYEGEHFTGAQAWVLDQLDSELRFDEEILVKTNISLPMFVQEVINLDLQRPSKWAAVKADNSQGWDTVWPLAMKMLAMGKVYTLRELMLTNNIS